MPFNNNPNTFLDRQESTGGKTAWLAPLGSPQEVDNCLCRSMLSLEKAFQSAISRALSPCPADAEQSAVSTDSPHNSWVACIRDEIK